MSEPVDNTVIVGDWTDFQLPVKDQPIIDLHDTTGGILTHVAMNNARDGNNDGSDDSNELDDNIDGLEQNINTKVNELYDGDRKLFTSVQKDANDYVKKIQENQKTQEAFDRIRQSTIGQLFKDAEMTGRDSEGVLKEVIPQKKEEIYRLVRAGVDLVCDYISINWENGNVTKKPYQLLRNFFITSQIIFDKIAQVNARASDGYNSAQLVLEYGKVLFPKLVRVIKKSGLVMWIVRTYIETPPLEVITNVVCIGIACYTVYEYVVPLFRKKPTAIADVISGK